jgi:hypothetical protein
VKQVEPFLLWLGHLGEGRASELLDERGIRAVVQLAVEERAFDLHRELAYCRFPLVDGCGNDPALLAAAVLSTASLLERRVPVLVCCGAGMSRSPSIAAAALALAERMQPEQALEIVSQHAAIDVLPGLWQEIVETLKGRPIAGQAFQPGQPDFPARER